MLVLGRVYKLQVYIYQKIIHDSCRKIYRRPMDPMPTEKKNIKKIVDLDVLLGFLFGEVVQSSLASGWPDKGQLRSGQTWDETHGHLVASKWKNITQYMYYIPCIYPFIHGFIRPKISRSLLHKPTFARNPKQWVSI